MVKISSFKIKKIILLLQGDMDGQMKQGEECECQNALHHAFTIDENL